jgi:large-conductance mechanosensitive channel
MEIGKRGQKMTVAFIIGTAFGIVVGHVVTINWNTIIKFMSKNMKPRG